MMTKLKAAALLAGVCTFGFFYGCILSPGSDPPPNPIPPAEYKDLTHKEDPLSNLILSYNRAEIARYEELLHPLYTFYNQTDDVQNNGLAPYLIRDTDVNVTTKLFEAAKGRLLESPNNLEKLTLQIMDGSWMQLDTVPGLPGPCEDCWTTTREYIIDAVLVGGTTTLHGNDLVQMIVVPVDENGKKLYKLYRLEDIAK